MEFVIEGDQLVIKCPHTKAHWERYPLAEADALVDLARAGAFQWTCSNGQVVDVSAKTARNLVEFLEHIPG